MPITFTVNFTGTPDEFDKRAAELCIQRENEWRAAQEPPLDELPSSNNTQLKAGVIAYFERLANDNQWTSYREQAEEESINQANLKERFKLADQATRDQIESLLPSLPSKE